MKMDDFSFQATAAAAIILFVFLNWRIFRPSHQQEGD
jgi:hypothetical protein